MLWICFSNLISDYWWTHFVPCLRSFFCFFFMCWFVMPITGCTVSFHCSFFFVHFWFLPCDLCNTCCGVPCLKLKDDVDLMCKYCIKKQNKTMCQTCRGMWNNQQDRMKIMLKNNVMMNVVRNIFLYFEIIRKKGQKYKVGKSCWNTTKGMFLLIYKFFT